MMIQIIVLFVIVGLACLILYLTTRPVSQKTNDVFDFIQVTEMPTCYVLYSNMKNFPKNTVEINYNKTHLDIFARIMIKSDHGVEEWESIHKSWPIPENADISAMKKTVTKNTVIINVPKKLTA